MKLVRASLFLITICVFAGALSAQTREFTVATGSGTGELGPFAKWDFSTSRGEYELSDAGVLTRVGGASRNLVPEKNGSVSGSVRALELDADLLVLFELSDSEGGWGKLVRLSGTTLKVKWSADINSFNVGGVVEGQSAYVTGMGFVGKVNLATGKYLWKHDGFYRKYRKSGAFNIIETPEIKGSTVVFTEKQEGKSPNVMSVNKMTGKIIKVTIGK
jgi:hypothetical protein